MSFDETNLTTLILRAVHKTKCSHGKMFREALLAIADEKLSVRVCGSRWLPKGKDPLHLAWTAEVQNEIRWWEKTPWSIFKSWLLSEHEFQIWLESAHYPSGDGREERPSDIGNVTGRRGSLTKDETEALYAKWLELKGRRPTIKEDEDWGKRQGFSTVRIGKLRKEWVETQPPEKREMLTKGGAPKKHKESTGK